METRPVPSDNESVPSGDPWAAFGYLVAGVAFYGAIGWGLSVWLHATFWVPVGVLFGGALGTYQLFSRYRFRTPETPVVNADAAGRSTLSDRTRPLITADEDCRDQPVELEPGATE